MKPRGRFVMDPQFFPSLFGAEELARLQDLVEIDANPVDWTGLAPSSEARGVELIVAGWGMPTLDEEFLGRFPDLRVVFYAAGTVKAIATNASWARGVRITSAALENARPVAEYTLAATIFSLKRLWARMFELREQRLWTTSDPLVAGGYRSTVGLIGLGKIGRLTAERLSSLDVKVLAYDPYVSAEQAAVMGVELRSLEQVFAESDVVSCHLPLSSKTEQVLGRRHFSVMKPGATFINTARGAVVNQAELVAVLLNRPDLYAVLDVAMPEPLPRSSPLFALKNVVLTPHVAGSIGPECRRMGLMMVDELERYLAGRPMLGEVLQEHVAILA